MDHFGELQHAKHALRIAARARRRQHPDAEEASQRILSALSNLTEFTKAATVLTYLHFHDEVRTQAFLPHIWQSGKQIVIPYCVADRLELFRLQSLDELAPGTMGILEPKAELRHQPQSRATINEIDLVIVPGLAFDAHCSRIGYGKGYFDRLLHNARSDAALVAVAFQCQIFETVPILPYDVRVDMVITEHTIYHRTEPRSNGVVAGH